MTRNMTMATAELELQKIPQSKNLKTTQLEHRTLELLFPAGSRNTLILFK